MLDIEIIIKIRRLCMEKGYLELVPKKKEEIEYSENPMDDSGGNYDDAYSQGVSKGEADGYNQCHSDFQPLIEYVEKIGAEILFLKDTKNMAREEILRLEAKVERLVMAMKLLKEYGEDNDLDKIIILTRMALEGE